MGLDNVVIVLVQPQHPGNVGAAARAMRNMGLSQLVLVDPPAWDPERARWMAPGCDELLANARVVGTLADGLAGCQRAIASTARHRKGTQAVLDASAAATSILDAPDGVRTAILFGREDNGLDAASVDACHAVLRIATPEHASLNLGQAVLLVAHALFTEARQRGLQPSGRYLGGRGEPKPTSAVHRGGGRGPADWVAMEPAVEDLVGLLERVGYTRSATPEKVGQTARTALQRANLSFKDVQALRGMVRRIDWALDHPELDPRTTSSG